MPHLANITAFNKILIFEYVSAFVSEYGYVHMKAGAIRSEGFLELQLHAGGYRD